MATPVTATFAALLSAVGFSGASLLALLGKGMGVRGRSYSVAVAAGLLLALAFADLFPEALELSGRTAVWGFVGGFSFLLLVETFTRAHTHHSPAEHVREHALAPLVMGLAVHNLADGFALGVSAELSAPAAGAVGLGVLVHQAPVGISLAAILAAAHATRAQVLRVAVPLGLAIPLAAALTTALPAPGDRALGLLVGAAGGVLAYMGASHLLPEAQAEHRSRVPGVLFVATLAATTLVLFTLLGG
ncbi:ZIP family metal transporter [Rubrobacter marinus]|uniref:ZIP family metal transporter n=1 Tax=Rubrobacter marinus TaxID=2653852 RepID=UPI001D187A67|nr:ZIP family metal transporter [Rubrobacter marinus]